ncbi:MAG: tetratricopeptide (TPR) repeat protein [Cognaticolwellia sp.]|jgi:tetratricopeptide (TPR) repeat protein
MLWSVLACAIRPGIVIPHRVTPQEKLEEANQVFKSRDYAGALLLYRALANDPDVPTQVRVEAMAQTARMMSLTGELEAGRSYLDQALALSSIDEPLGWTRTQGVKGIYQREDGDAAGALDTFSQAYTYAMNREMPLRAIDMAHHAALVAPQDGQIEWAEKGISAATAAGSIPWLAVLHNNLGSAYEDKQDYPTALEQYRIALDFRRQLSDPTSLLIAEWAVAHAERLSDEPGARDSLEAVLSKAQSAYQSKPSAGTAEWVGYTLEDLAELTHAEGDPEQARVLMDEAIAKYVEAGLEEHWPEKLELARMRRAEMSETPY